MNNFISFILCFTGINSYLYIRAAKSFFNVPREKSSPRPVAAETEQSEVVKGFCGQGV
jgi:hypothetical protein